MALEDGFDTTFIAALSSREKQIQQTYRPVIGIHKWFARRPGTLFRGLLLSEFAAGPLKQAFYRGHSFADKIVADPFMGGGTPLIEATRLGMRVIGTDINPMAYWIVRQSLASLDLVSFREQADRMAIELQDEIGPLYQTRCIECDSNASVKYFLWVKQSTCLSCGEANDLFPGYLVAKNDRHVAFVWYCPGCDHLAEITAPPSRSRPISCPHCAIPLKVEGPARRGQYRCTACGANNRYPDSHHAPTHRLFAIEYYCHECCNRHAGRYFKVPDAEDLQRYEDACHRLLQSGDSWVPQDVIPAGDETTRLHRWGYRRYRELFNDRQLLGLQSLLCKVAAVEDSEVRLALATVCSDMLRYQNMLARYDTYALKCQDVFSVHGFPVGLVQCENNLLGIPGIGGGGFQHFVTKYQRAKEYCNRPHEVVGTGHSKRRVHTNGERIAAQLGSSAEDLGPGEAFLAAADARVLNIRPNTLDGVFTDPPYFDNVQYAELMDFCYVWLRQILKSNISSFAKTSTRNVSELTGNVTLGRGIEDFTDGLSEVFQRIAVALKPGSPLVFTYHHNDPEAYVPLIVAILDAGLLCTATLCSPAEMSASLHINGTGSSTVDSIFVCRKQPASATQPPKKFPDCLYHDIAAIQEAGVRISPGDISCIALGHLSRLAIQELSTTWEMQQAVSERMQAARGALKRLLQGFDLQHAMSRAAPSAPESQLCLTLFS